MSYGGCDFITQNIMSRLKINNHHFIYEIVQNFQSAEYEFASRHDLVLNIDIKTSLL